MQQKVAIARALLTSPILLLMDEPTTGLDPRSKLEVQAFVEELRDTHDATIVLTTHDMAEAERLCDRIGIIDEGLIKAEGTRRELIALVGGRDRIGMVATGNLREAAAAAALVERVEEASAVDGGIDVIVTEARTILPRILEVVGAAGAVIRSVEVVEPDLEAVFLHLTGKALRD